MYIDEPSAWDTLDDLCRVSECSFEDLAELLADDFYAEKAESGALYFEVNNSDFCAPIETAMHCAADEVEEDAYMLLSDKVLPSSTVSSSVDTVMKQPGMESVRLLPVVMNGKVFGFKLFFRDQAALDLLAMRAGKLKGHFNGGSGWYDKSGEVLVFQEDFQGGVTGLLTS